MDKLIGWLFLIIGLFSILTVIGLPLLKIQLWVMAIGFFLIGFLKLIEK